MKGLFSAKGLCSAKELVNIKKLYSIKGLCSAIKLVSTKRLYITCTKGLCSAKVL